MPWSGIYRSRINGSRRIAVHANGVEMSDDRVSSILIVEDESIVGLDIKQHLLRFGYHVLGPVASAEDAIVTVEKSLPDLVLMDIRLQGEMDGVEASGIIREKYNKPVILLTAYADDNTVDRAKKSNPFGYILKPFNERELRTTIEMAMYRHSMELQLKESEKRYRRLFEEDLSGDFVTDGEGRIVDCNPAFLYLFGFESINEARGKSIDSLFVNPAQADFMWQNIRKKGIIKLQEFAVVSADNRHAMVLANIIGNYSIDGKLTSLHGYFMDTTEIKSLEEQLRQAQKMEAIGRMAGGIAHDFNNLLTVILGYVTLGKEKYKDGEAVEVELEGIRTAAGRATTLTRQLLAFSRQQVLNPEVVNINSLITDLEKMISRLLPESIRLVTFTTASNPGVFVDPGQIEQVLLNLAVNARDAMGSSGTLSIESGNREFNEDYVSAMGTVPSGQYCTITVTDSGDGIPEDILPLIFEPFFTTKSADKGTGLGLSTVYGIVKQSKGYIEVQSQSGKGTVFTLYFPVTLEKVSEELPNIPDIALLSGDEKILLVEDDNSVRRVIVNILKRAGYTVFEAQNAGEALLIFEEKESEVDIVLTDYIMPHMTGDKLIKRFHKKKPDLPSVLISGYLKRANKVLPDADAFLPKPFQPEELLRVVRSVLDNASIIRNQH